MLPNIRDEDWAEINRLAREALFYYFVLRLCYGKTREEVEALLYGKETV